MPSESTIRTYRSHEDFADPALRACALNPEHDLACDVNRWLGYVDQELARLRADAGLVCTGYRDGRPVYEPATAPSGAEEGESFGTASVRRAREAVGLPTGHLAQPPSAGDEGGRDWLADVIDVMLDDETCDCEGPRLDLTRCSICDRRLPSAGARKPGGEVVSEAAAGINKDAHFLGLLREAGEQAFGGQRTESGGEA